MAPNEKTILPRPLPRTTPTSKRDSLALIGATETRTNKVNATKRAKVATWVHNVIPDMIE